MKKYEDLIATCESELRSGQLNSIAKILGDINPGLVPRVHILSLANVCRRAANYHLGLKLLAPIVYPKGRRAHAPPTAQEISEYSVLLLRIGAVAEAVKLLQTVDAKAAPSALLTRAFAHFVCWEHGEAIPYLKRYVGAGLSDYESLVGKANLANALVYSRLDGEAFELLGELIESTRRLGHLRLAWNCHVLQAQLAIQSGNLEKARSEIETADRLITTPTAREKLMLRKWQSVRSALLAGDPGEIDSYQEVALENADYDGRRELEIYRLKVGFDRERFARLLAGTPHAAFRMQALRALNLPAPPECYIFGAKTGRLLDLDSGLIEDMPSRMRPGAKTHLLLRVLLSDLFCPTRLGGLFSKLFPGERYDCLTSPNRVHQIFRRARALLKDEQIPIEIVERKHMYRVEINGDFGIRLSGGAVSVDSRELQFARIESSFNGELAITAREIADELKISPRSAVRLIAWAEAAGKIERYGAGKNTYYCLPPARAAAA